MGEKTPGLEDLFGFVKRNRWIVLGSTLGLGLGTAVLIAILVPPTFEASTTLVVSPATFSSELSPSALTVQGYQTLLESDAVVSETKRRLIGADGISPESSLRLRRELESRIFVSRRSEATALAPMIEASARHPSADTAAHIANTWAEVFLERTHNLTSRTTMMTVRFIDEQYREAQQSVEELGQEAMEATNQFQERIDEATLRWDRRLVSFKNTTEDLTAEYQTESRLLIEDLAREHGLEEGSPDEVGSLGGRLSVSAETRKRLRQLVALRVQLAQTPQFIVLEKAISDDALWQAMALGPDRLLELQSQNLLTEELSPVFSELSLRLSGIESDLGIIELEDAEAVRSFTAALEKLQRERSAALSKLQAERAVEADALRMAKAREIEALKRLRDSELDRLDRNIRHSQQLFDELATKQKQAGLAKSQGTIRDVHLASPAVPPPQPEPRGIALKALFAAFLGAFLGLGVALFREVSPASLS